MLSIHSAEVSQLKPNFWLLFCLAVGFFCLALSPSLFKLNTYRPKLVGVKGYESILVTEPYVVSGIVKGIRVWWEVSPSCYYKILGWDEQNQLYYESICHEERQVRRFSVEERESVAIPLAPNELIVNPIPDEELLAKVHFERFSPAHLEAITRPLYYEEGSALSSKNGQLIAFVQQALYSEYDIVILKPQFPPIEER
jgi:hypothetical protein